MSGKPVAKPNWIKNTYFWIGLILFAAGIIGLPFLGGDSAIRDPGQKKESYPLFIIYLVASVLMVINGILSHRHTVQAYNEQQEDSSANK